ncbi:MAG: transcription antitermination factor NusB [Verrucomicrobiales bacterium]
MSSVRREGREAAVQFLYSLDQNPPPDPSRFDLFWSVHQAGPGARKFAESLVHGVLANRQELDQQLAQALAHWSLERLEVVDRNVLRLAAYEMFFCLDTPPIVAINEAIEVARRLGTPDSPRFVNGVLDELKKFLTRPLRSPSPT